MGFCALHFDHGVFPNAHLAVILPTRRAKVSDDLTSEVAQASGPVAALIAHELLAMHRAQASWLCDSKQLGDQEIEMGKEFIIVGRVSHILDSVTVDIE